MIFGRKRQKALEDAQLGKRTYWSFAWERFRENKRAVWSWRVFIFMVFIAISGDFWANDKPLYCRIDGKSYVPIVQDYWVKAGWSKWDAKFLNTPWVEQEFESVWWPLIPYSSERLDYKNTYAGPFSKQDIPSWRFRHWFGTDDLGRDVAAGMIAGTRTALLVGIVAMSIALVIGLLLGSLAGYFGDDGLKLSRIRIILNVLGLLAGLFWGFSSRSYAISDGHQVLALLQGLVLLVALILLANLLAKYVERSSFWGKEILVPVDLLVIRLIEMVNAIPGLLLILAFVAAIQEESILFVMLIIGFLAWTGIARFVRAELLRIRKMEYIEAARALGFGRWHIIFRHALPNALGPVLIALSFGMAGAVLLEATLSFLNIGVPEEQVTWGSLLRESRSYAKAWWLTIFPGLAIFLSVTIFNYLGDGLTEALDPRLREKE
ncbi:MAG: ABC transporter permease [Saprospiraceae bacterium]